jgi:uncharacterized protein
MSKLKQPSSSSSNSRHRQFTNEKNPEGSFFLQTKLWIYKRLLYTTLVSAPDEAQDYQTTPLHDSARRGSVPEVLFWIEKGTPVDVLCEHGFTALHLAIVNGQKQVVTALLQLGANPNASTAVRHSRIARRNRCFRTALADLRSLEISGFAALHLAILTHDQETVNKLLRHGANVQSTPPLVLSFPWPAQPVHVDSALSMAVCHAQAAIVNSFLHHIADFNCPAPYFWTALHVASFTNFLPIAKALLQKCGRVDLMSDWMAGFLRHANNRRNNQSSC